MPRAKIVPALCGLVLCSRNSTSKYVYTPPKQPLPAATAVAQWITLACVLQFGALSQWGFFVKERIALTKRAGLKPFNAAFFFFQESGKSNFDNFRARHFILQHDRLLCGKSLSAQWLPYGKFRTGWLFKGNISVTFLVIILHWMKL